jgi:hypothetical protein
MRAWIYSRQYRDNVCAGGLRRLIKTSQLGRSPSSLSLAFPLARNNREAVEDTVKHL